MQVSNLISKHKISLIILAVIILLGLFYFAGIKYLFLNYSFDYEDCKENNFLTSGFEKLTDIQWIGNDLIISGKTNFNCGGNIDGDYKLEANIINLYIKDKMFYFPEMCNCDRNIKFKIKNLPQENYEIKYFDKTNNQNRLRDWVKMEYPDKTTSIDCNQYPEESIKECLLKRALVIPENSDCDNLPTKLKFECYADESCTGLPEDGDWNIRDVCYNRFEDLANI